MASPSPAYPKLPVSEREKRPIAGEVHDLRRDHARRVENFPQTSTRKRGSVKFPPRKKNFCILTFDDGLEAFLHRESFDGDWPPPYRKTVEFDAIESAHPRTRFRAENAQLVEPEQ